MLIFCRYCIYNKIVLQLGYIYITVIQRRKRLKMLDLLDLRDTDLRDPEKTLLKLIIKRQFFNCSKCEEENGIETGHENHRLDIHATENDIVFWFNNLNVSLIGKNLDFSFLKYNSNYIKLAISELVSEGFLTPMDKPCIGCGGFVYVRTDTMKHPAWVVLAEDGQKCRFS